MPKIDKKKAKKVYNKLMMSAASLSPAMVDQIRLLYSLLSGQVEDTRKSYLVRVLSGEEPADLINELTTSANSLATKIPKPMGMIKKTRKKDKIIKPAEAKKLGLDLNG